MLGAQCSVLGNGFVGIGSAGGEVEDRAGDQFGIVAHRHVPQVGQLDEAGVGDAVEEVTSLVEWGDPVPASEHQQDWTANRLESVRVAEASLGCAVDLEDIGEVWAARERGQAIAGLIRVQSSRACVEIAQQRPSGRRGTAPGTAPARATGGGLRGTVGDTA